MNRIEFGPTECRECLDDLLRQVGSYRWLWRVLSARAHRTGYFPGKLHRLLQRLGNPKKPYCIAETADGIAVLGDHRDAYLANVAVFLNAEGVMTRFLRERIAGVTGAYVDVGANHGLLAAAVARSRRDDVDVVAFEPNPSTARCAAATFALNRLDNVRLYQWAISDSDGVVPFLIAPGRSAQSSVHAIDRLPGDRPAAALQTTVACRTLDSLADEGILGRVGLVKLDVEGHEVHVVRGAARLLSAHQPELIVEHNARLASVAGWAPEGLAALVGQAGDYHFQVLHQDGTLASFPPSAVLPGVTNIHAVALQG